MVNCLEMTLEKVHRPNEEKSRGTIKTWEKKQYRGLMMFLDIYHDTPKQLGYQSHI